MRKKDTKHGSEAQVKERVEFKTPSLYQVFLLNDDYTTMEFVIHVLEKIFRKPPAEAAQIMLHVHKNGRGLAGIYPRGIAETKVAAVQETAQLNSFPLKCIMEKE